MSKVEDLRASYEDANAAAAKLSGEHQAKVDKLSEKRRELKDRYADRIDEANRAAADAQAELMAYEAAQALLDRGEEGESTLQNHTGKGGERLHKAYRDLKRNT